jgi:predicted enzyme related to lactoylglutathione lyase
MAYSTEPGHVGWIDLTVPNAEEVRDFYAAVAHWSWAPIEMPDRTDYGMTAGNEPVGGICHAVGDIATLPPQWLIYINVPDLDAAVSEATARGGSIIAGPRGVEPDMRFAVLRDPAGAPFALIEQGASEPKGEPP